MSQTHNKKKNNHNDDDNNDEHVENDKKLPASSRPTKRSRFQKDDHNDDNNNDETMSSNDDTAPTTPTLHSVISSSVLTRSTELATAYRKALPFPHGIVEQLCVDGLLEAILEEVKQNSKVKFKESDLFRVYQSIDLGNLHPNLPLAKQLPSLMKLKSALYSPEYRAFVEVISNLEPGTLTDEVDCAANCHTKGCHLLCHDDVIGTRKVSFIIYLTDPEPTWQEGDGGQLELYDCMPADEKGETTTTASSNNTRVPRAFPSKTILPRFNTMAYFGVEPGVSFHAVQEVFCDRPRLSLQGWYHAANAPAQGECSTLNRLKSTQDGEDTEGDFLPLSVLEDPPPPPPPPPPQDEDESSFTRLSDSDRNYLQEYINPIYLTEESMSNISKLFEEDSSVQLRHFLHEKWASQIQRAAKSEDDALGFQNKTTTTTNAVVSNYEIGTNKEWNVVGPAHKQRFLEYVGGKTVTLDSAGSLLQHVRSQLLESAPFRRFLRSLSSLGMTTGLRGRIRRFRPGLDYTVAHYGILCQEAVLDATLCFGAGTGNPCRRDEETGKLVGDGKNAPTEDDALWDSGDVGGFECYIEADDDDEEDEEKKNGDEKAKSGNNKAAAEYDENDDTELLSISLSNNTLSLVYRDPGTMRFVKYVGSGAPSSRWDISLEYQVENTDDEEQQQEDEMDEEKEE